MYLGRMEIEQLVAALVGVRPDTCDPAIDWDQRGKLWFTLAKRAEDLIGATLPAAFCTAQEWDNRIDCQLQLADGSVVGEMIGLDGMNIRRLKETAERLRRVNSGEYIELVDPIQSPLYTGGPLPNVS
jgi:hypothetical protein